MIKIEWFNDKIKNDYVRIINDKNKDKEESHQVGSVFEKVKKDLENAINNNKFPTDIAQLFLENNVVSDVKIQEFLKLSFSQVKQIPALKGYIDRCSLIISCLKSVNKEDFQKWLKVNTNRTIGDYLDEKLAAYKNRYPNYPLKYPLNALTSNWPRYFKSKIEKAVLSEPYDEVFDYDKIDDKMRHKLMDSLNIQVCPFCNRQYITSWDDIDVKYKKSTADLDHFFPKSEYSLFALSLFNFVPSCQICNSRMKISKFIDEDGNRPIYPYEEFFDDTVIFKASVSDVKKQAKELLEVWLGENTDDMKITLFYGQKDDKTPLTPYQENVKRSNELYHLEDVYQAHKGYVSELMLKRRIYDDGEYLNGLRKIFNNFDISTFSQDSNDMVYNIIGTELNITHKQLELFLYGFNWADGQDPTRPLSKLAYDILKR